MFSSLRILDLFLSIQHTYFVLHHISDCVYEIVRKKRRTATNSSKKKVLGSLALPDSSANQVPIVFKGIWVLKKNWTFIFRLSLVQLSLFSHFCFFRVFPVIRVCFLNSIFTTVYRDSVNCNQTESFKKSMRKLYCKLRSLLEATKIGNCSTSVFFYPRLLVLPLPFHHRAERRKKKEI